jgi:hypothetical protein
MRRLSASLIVGVWERGQGLDAVEQALLLLSVAYPGVQPETLAEMSIGRRDAHLLAFRRQIFAGDPNGFGDCPNCTAGVEYRLPPEALSQAPAEREERFEFSLDEFSLRLRMPNSGDMAVARDCTGMEEAKRSLAQRCVLEATRAGVVLTAEELPAPVMDRLSQFLDEAASSTELLIDLVCPQCGHKWQVVFDIASYLWTEINALARRFLREVHILARAYGWREADILSMSAKRREYYLEMAG